MESKYDEILELAEKYLDTRYNDVHVPLSYIFAGKLLEYYPDADEDIVLPAIILHDVGWKMIPEDEQKKGFGPNPDKDEQRVHELEGVKIAEEILISMEYDKEKILKILQIIDGHDTRKEAISLNDKIVKDADKLWRFSPVTIEIDLERFSLKRNELLGSLNTKADEWFFTLEAKDIALEELGKSKKEPSNK